tara:strand:- start:782 stop:1387 length:606 start_codon:yes stop_codon:yes gene_type:complete
MTAIANIREYIAKQPEGQPFASTELRQFASTDNIRQILNRLVKSNEIKKVARGVFVKPKSLTMGEKMPLASEIAEAVAQTTGETIMVHGAEAARQLQLTTQVPTGLVFYTDGNSRTLKMGNRTVRLKHINPSRMIEPGTVAGLVITALIYLGKENVTPSTIDSIKKRIPEEDFKKTINLISRMPAWLSDVFFRYQKETQNG